jgi:hypothetical protein
MDTTTVESFHAKLKVDLPKDPIIPLMGKYLKECKSGYKRATCTPMFTKALFITVKLWKQSRCLIIDELINKMWYI